MALSADRERPGRSAKRVEARGVGVKLVAGGGRLTVDGKRSRWERSPTAKDDVSGLAGGTRPHGDSDLRQPLFGKIVTHRFAGYRAGEGEGGCRKLEISFAATTVEAIADNGMTELG